MFVHMYYLIINFHCLLPGRVTSLATCARPYKFTTFHYTRTTQGPFQISMGSGGSLVLRILRLHSLTCSLGTKCAADDSISTTSPRGSKARKTSDSKTNGKKAANKSLASQVEYHIPPEIATSDLVLAPAFLSSNQRPSLFM